MAPVEIIEVLEDDAMAIAVVAECVDEEEVTVVLVDSGTIRFI